MSGTPSVKGGRKREREREVVKKSYSYPHNVNQNNQCLSNHIQGLQKRKVDTFLVHTYSWRRGPLKKVIYIYVCV